MNKEMLAARNLDVGYGKSVLISDVNITVEAGKIVTLIGPNGSGKSTILKTFTKQLKIMGGKVSVLDRDIKEMSEAFMAEHVSMVMTERLKPQLMTCREVVGTGRYPYTGKLGILTESDWHQVDKALEIVKAEEIADCDFNEISDGQKQRIMLARAICQDTEVIVLDEPTSYLDLFYKLDLMKIIKRLAVEQNKAVIMSLHELDLVKMVSDVVVCVDGKKICKAGTVTEVFAGNFIQKLYGLQDDEFDAESAVLCWSGAVAQGYVAPCRPQPELEAGEDGERERSAEQPTRNAVKGCAQKKVIMVQGTMSNAGKSLVVAALCRIFKQDGYRVAPFKSQNMALNSFITKEGLEMGRAQVMQAEAAGIEPMVCMNPILLKPTNDKGSQVIVNGEVIGNMEAREYFKYKKSLVPEILKAFEKLEEVADIIVIEGAGSPAEINLRENDIVNMGLAELVDAPVLLVGDIDRGGVFAQLLGTVSLLEESERARIKGLVINKFRGDKSLLDSGIDMLVEKCGISVTGVLPYMHISIDDEDSLSGCFEKKALELINIGVVRLPRISNFTDFNVFEQIEGVAVHYLAEPGDVEKMDFVILPGSKNTIGDLLWLRESGFEAAVKKFAMDRPVFGICGGFQMLGAVISDPDGVEEGGTVRGMELLPVKTVLEKEKVRTQVCKTVENLDGIFEGLSGKNVCGYEIHMGKTCGAEENLDLSDGGCINCGDENFTGGMLPSKDFCVVQSGNVYGSYVHGFFDEGDVASIVVQALAKAKGVSLDGKVSDFKAFKESQYDLLAKTVRENINMEEIYKILNREV